MEIQVYTNRQIPSSLKKPATQLVGALVEKLELDIAYLNVIFVKDSELKDLHKKYLKEDSETDVITFNLQETGAIEGEIYISASRASAQALDYGVTPTHEICRLIVHGCLHLAGYDDHDEVQRKRMKSKEDALTDALHRIFNS